MAVEKSYVKWQSQIHCLRKCYILMVLSFCGLAASRHCDHHHYWDSRGQVCRPCTKCPINEIIRKPCGRHSNTVCGPFQEFNFFNQLDDLDSSQTPHEYETFFSENSSGVDTMNVPRKTGGRQNEPIVQRDDGEYWKNLAFALIGVVCVLIFVATIVVLVACKKLHESVVVKCPEEEDDDDSDYVVIRAIRPPDMLRRAAVPPAPVHIQSAAARALLVADDIDPLPSDVSCVSQRPEMHLKGAYTPVRQLLNYDTDDVFECDCEDSSGSKFS